MISCEQYDYIEIVCTFRYAIKLTMKSGIVIEGIALDTKLNSNKVECLNIDINGSETLIILDDLSKLDVCVANPHFHVVYFD